MTVGVRHDDLRRRNRAMVIGAVRRATQPSRTEIAQATELSNSTISAIASDLLTEGVLVETKGEASLARRGRPQVALNLNPDFGSVIAVVLTLNQLWTTRINYDGKPADEEIVRLPTLTMGRDELVAAVTASIRRIIGKQSRAAQRPQRIALALQGITDAASTTLLWSPITPHSDIPFAQLLEAEFGIPVTVQNDCNMIAVALRWRRPERYRDDFFAILLSNGIGMGLMQKGKLFTGTHSSGGEFGHMIHMPQGALCRCGRRGCIEAYAGNYAVVRSASGGNDNDAPAADIGEAEMEALAEAARSREGAERAAFRKAGDAIGYGLGSLFALFDPAPVAIVGPGAVAFDIMERPIREAIAQTAGGQHSGAISFATETDEMPLIREGCAMTALDFVDARIAAPGRSAAPGRQVA